MEKKNKVLYAASTQSHLERFHMPYIEALREHATVLTMANGNEVDFSIPFDKHFFSLTNLRIILKIRKILKREKFDSILVHTTLAAFLIRAALIGVHHRPHVLNVVHGYLFAKEPRGMKDRILLLCERLLRRQTDEIAVMNEEDRLIAQTHRLCRGEVFFLYGMGVPDSVPKLHPDIALQQQLGLAPTDFVCTFVGELSNRKNQIFLIRAAKMLRDKKIPVKLLLVGEGNERESLENEIQRLNLSDTVLLTGSQTPIFPYLSVTHLYVSASRSEGLPFNIMEAMACGLPILASNTKGQTDLLAQTPSALYPFDDMDAFCSAVKDIYHTSKYGIEARTYPILSQYLLNSVFKTNMKILTRGIDSL